MEHVKEAFPQANLELSDGSAGASPPPPYRLLIPPETARANEPPLESAEGGKPTIVVEPYSVDAVGPYPEDKPRMNPTRFTPMRHADRDTDMNHVSRWC